MITEKEKEIFADVFRFFKKHKDNDTLDQWVGAAKEMGEIDTKHNMPLCRNLLTAVWDTFFQNKGEEEHEKV